MKIKKIYIQNFKWIKDKRIIELDKDITFLTWPNGFWKTTIFDVIELCLTWKLYRTFQKEHVTNDNKDYSKPFYQNTKWEDVVIKLWLEKEWKKLIIVKFLSKDNKWTSQKWKKKNKVTDFNLIETYLDKTEEFNDNFFNIETKEKISNNDKINTFLWLRNENIDKLYPLFNYLQQEETIYFLKLSENERKEELNFLFNTETEWKIETKINDFLRWINSVIKKVNEKLIKIEEWITIQNKNIENKEKVEYEVFFDSNDKINTDIIDFDKKELFNKNIDNNKYYKSKYLENINNVKDFLESFSINEYKNDKKKTNIQKIKNDKIFIESFILQKYNTSEKILELEKDNEIYNLSKKDYYLESLIYEKYLEKNEIEKLKEKDFLYNLCNSDEYNSSLEAFILQNQLNDEAFLKEWKIKNTLINYIDKSNNILDQFLLEKFDKNKDISKSYNYFNNKKTDFHNYDLEKEYSIYNNIKNDDNNIIIKWFLLNNYFTTKDNYTKSKYKELEELHYLHKKVEKYINYKKDEKIEKFEEIYRLLKLDNNELLNDFTKNIERNKELENDLKWNNKIISELIELRIDLINLFKKKWFDETCILCWTKEVNGVNIKDFETFEKIVKEKTENIKNVSDSKIDEQEQINKKINNNILELEKYINLFINKESIKKSIKEFNVLKKYLTQEEYKPKELEINILIENNKEYKISKNIFDIIDEEIKNLKKYLEKKYIDWFNLYSQYKKLEWRGELFLDENILINFLKDKKISYKIEKEWFNNIKYNEIKDNIIDSLNDYLKWFTSKNNMYIILDNLANWRLSNIYKENTNKLNDFLRWNIEKENFLINDKSYDFNVDMNLYKGKLKKYILNKTEDSSKLYSKISNILEKKKFIDKDKYILLKNELIKYKIDFKLNKIEDYNSDYEENSIISLEERIYKVFKNRILIYQKLNYLQKEKINNYNELLNDYKFEKIKEYILENYNDYDFFDDYKNNIIKFLDKEFNYIDIDIKKLWWDNSDFINIIFNKDILLIEKYKKIKSKLENKKKYIEYKYFEIENNLLIDKTNEYDTIKERLNLLKNNKIKTLKDIYTDEINSYKSRMIDWIKIPFYLYTAKILQNFQQWMWIFMVFESEKSIRFYTEWESNHDAMHHLSSWQLAVVSIAFTLAVNTVYKISNELRFLNIDDPVQEMDSLNIHSFIELIRHNFMDYKLIISTHSDENAYFMKYKIEKIKENSVKMINVQSEFFNTENKDSKK